MKEQKHLLILQNKGVSTPFYFMFDNVTMFYYNIRNNVTRGDYYDI